MTIAADPTAVASNLGIDTGHVYRHALTGFSAQLSPVTVNALEALPAVDYVQADRRVKAFAQTTPTGINRADADLSPTAGLFGVLEAVGLTYSDLVVGLVEQALGRAAKG